MIWAAWAILAHVGNAVVFIVDKSLLTGKSVVSEPLKYTFWSGFLAVMAVVVLPWQFAPLTSWIVLWSVMAGLVHLAALWFFFTAMKRGEPSRVVPITGSIVPLATLVFTVTFLGERLGQQDLLAILVLIAGGALLSVRLGDTRGLGGNNLLFVAASGILFAGYFVLVKYLYDTTEAFLAVFAYSRVIEGLLALLLLGPFVLRRGKENEAMVDGAKRPRNYVAGAVFTGNKVLAAGAFMLQHLAIREGSVAVVNSLQGTQYLFLLIMAVVISKKWPQLFREELQRTSLIQKVAGITLTVLGLFILGWR